MAKIALKKLAKVTFFGAAGAKDYAKFPYSSKNSTNFVRDERFIE